MHYDKQKYEKLILESTLFKLDKEAEYVAFKRESYRMIEYLYCYLLSINEQEYEPYGYEITEVATRCINNFDSSKGEFLYYFNAAWKQEYSHILGAQQNENKYRGIRVTEEDRRAVRKYIRLAAQTGREYNAEEMYSKLSDAMELPVERIVELAKLSNLNVSGDKYISDDGEELSIWNQIPGTENIEQRIVTEENIENILNRIETAFMSLQSRQKPIVSDMMTIKICELLADTKTRDFSFISNSVMEQWTEKGTIPTQREIAKKYDRDEASISRTVKMFLEKLKKEG